MFLNFMKNVRLFVDDTVGIAKAIFIDSLPWFIVTVLCVEARERATAVFTQRYYYKAMKFKTICFIRIDENYTFKLYDYSN